MSRVSFAILTAALINVALAQAVTEIESTVQLSSPSYCVSRFLYLELF